MPGGLYEGKMRKKGNQRKMMGKKCKNEGYIVSEGRGGKGILQQFSHGIFGRISKF